MTSKGPSPVDLESPAPATPRRGFIGVLGAAGLATAAALTIARPASAAGPAPTAADKKLLRGAMELELTALALYDEALAAGLSDDAGALATVFAENHKSYADKIAAACGFSANTRNDEVFDALQSSFATSDAKAFAESAMGLENTAAATHSSLLPDYVSGDARQITAAIVVVEARMATVLADLAGQSSDLDELFEPKAEPLDLAGGTQ